MKISLPQNKSHNLLVRFWSKFTGLCITYFSLTLFNVVHFFSGMTGWLVNAAEVPTIAHSSDNLSKNKAVSVQGLGAGAVIFVRLQLE